jgi:hypothetical protein
MPHWSWSRQGLNGLPARLPTAGAARRGGDVRSHRSPHGAPFGNRGQAVKARQPPPLPQLPSAPKSFRSMKS